MSDGIPQYLTPKEVAERLKVPPKTILNWIYAGKLRGHKVGKHWRLLEGDVLAFIEASTQAERLERAERSER